MKEKLANGGNINEVLEEVEEESDDDSEELEEENKKIVRKYTRKKSVYMGDDPEKIALLAKISELEKDLIDNVKLEDDEARYGEEKIKKKENTYGSNLNGLAFK